MRGSRACSSATFKMKPSTVLTILYGLNLVTALVGAGFLAAFLGQLYAEGSRCGMQARLTADPLMVFELPVAIWVNGVAAFFGLLIAYLAIWYVGTSACHTVLPPPCPD